MHHRSKIDLVISIFRWLPGPSSWFRTIHELMFPSLIRLLFFRMGLNRCPVEITNLDRFASFAFLVHIGITTVRMLLHFPKRLASTQELLRCGSCSGVSEIAKNSLSTASEWPATGFGHADLTLLKYPAHWCPGPLWVRSPIAIREQLIFLLWHKHL